MARGKQIKPGAGIIQLQLFNTEGLPGSEPAEEQMEPSASAAPSVFIEPVKPVEPQLIEEREAELSAKAKKTREAALAALRKARGIK